LVIGTKWILRVLMEITMRIWQEMILKKGSAWSFGWLEGTQIMGILSLERVTGDWQLKRWCIFKI
jgi:hypothetical protein